MKAELGKEAEKQSRRPKPVTVTVNTRSVTLSEHKATGWEIKQIEVSCTSPD